MTSRYQPKLPVEPLMKLLGTDSFTEAAHRIAYHGDITKEPAIEAVARALHRARNTGLTVWMADKFAMALGLHPANVWGDLFYEVTAPVAA